MSLIHIVVTQLQGYDLFTLYFDDREEKDIKSDNLFIAFEKEFIPKRDEFYNPHPEDTFNQSYYGYFLFPLFSANEIFNLYKSKCEASPKLEKRYNIFFDSDHVNLEEMIKKFDRPIEKNIDDEHAKITYSHRLDYLARSVQILRDMQTAIYETGSDIALQLYDMHKRFLESKSDWQPE